MTEPWYWPVLQAFRKHQERCHADKGWDAIEEEVTFAEEALYYETWRDGASQEWRCCWVDCPWKIEWTPIYKLESFVVRRNE